MMKRLVMLAALGVGSSVSAFTVSVSPSSLLVKASKTTTNTALKLTPSQGSQLVDAYNAAHANKDNDDDDDFVAVGLHTTTNHPKPTATTTGGVVASTARALLHRLASLSTHDDSEQHHHHDDVVYYPVIGFTYVPDAKDHSRALPTVSNPSCRLVYEKLLDKQALYGEWKQPTSSSSSPADDAAAAAVAERSKEMHHYH